MKVCSWWARNAQLGILPFGAPHWQAILLRRSEAGQGSGTMCLKADSYIGDSSRIGFNSLLSVLEFTSEAGGVQGFSLLRGF